MTMYKLRTEYRARQRLVYSSGTGNRLSFFRLYIIFFYFQISRDGTYVVHVSYTTYVHSYNIHFVYIYM